MGLVVQEKNNMFEPITKKKQLIFGNSKSNTAILSLWTKKDEVAKIVEKERYCVIGQLYSAERGIDFLIRNLLANPNITNLVLTGKDLSNSGTVIEDFFKNGIEKSKTKHGNACWKIKSEFEGYIDLDFSKEELDMLRKNIYIEKILDLNLINNFTPKDMPLREKIIKIKKELSVENFGGEDSVFVVRQKKIVNAWIQILDLILKFGRLSPTQFESKQKEIIEIVTIISGEDPLNPDIPDFFPFDLSHFTKYCTTFLEGKKQEGLSYTYGERMRKFFGHDQVGSLVGKLSEDINTRQAVISLWDSETDIKGKESPCLNYIWVRVRENKIYLTAMLRSNDMFAGFPENAMALRLLQEKIRKELSQKIYKDNTDYEFLLGDLIIISNSAHLYEESWEQAKKIVENNYKTYITGLDFDERGNFYITVNLESKKIIVDYLSKTGEKIKTFEGATALELRDILIKENIVGNPGHGIYIGTELIKAEISLKNNIPYVQDNENFLN